MGGIFPPRRHTAHFRGRGQVAPPSIAHARAETVEARPNDLSRVAASRSERRGALDRRSVRSKLVACGCAQSASYRAARHVLLLVRCTASCCALTSTLRTAGCGPACPVVWEGSRRVNLSYSLSQSPAQRLPPRNHVTPTFSRAEVASMSKPSTLTFSNRTLLNSPFVNFTLPKSPILRVKK
jgi:hypothetical protein